MTNDETELAIIELQELRNRMDRAIEESAKGEGTDDESFMQEILDRLNSPNWERPGPFPEPPAPALARTVRQGEFD